MLLKAEYLKRRARALWLAPDKMLNSFVRLAEEAVIGEPVSAGIFPVKRENTGKFAAFGLEMTKAPRLSGGISIICEPNSLAAKAGKICGRTGNPKAHNSE